MMTRIPLKLLALLPVVMCLALPGHAQDTTSETPQSTQENLPDMEQIERAYQTGDFVLVRRGLEALARDESNTLAHYRYGRVLLQGLGGPADPEQAVIMLQKAVAQNHLQAATLLARLHLSDGAFYDATTAAGLLSNAAARGHADAKYYLALLYQSGKGVTQDDTQAFSWFLAAAEDQHTKAKFEVSKAYSRGLGTEENVDQAMKWLRSAAEDGDAEAQYFYGNALDLGPEAYRNKREALDWLRRAAEAGHPLAQRNLGTKYLGEDESVRPDPEEALRWLTAAAEGEDRGAMHNLGIAYASGKVLPRDDQLAAYWFERGSQLDLGRSSLALAALYQSGRGVDQSIDQAVKFYRLAIEQGELGAVARLADLAIDGSLQGLMAPHDVAGHVAYVLQETDRADAFDWLKAQSDAGVRPAQEYLASYYLRKGDDPAVAAALLEQAATAGSVTAQARLGMLYSTGEGVELDYVAAHTWLNIAAASGHQEAAETRELMNDLMTPEQIIQAQAAARAFFDSASDRTPDTDQIVRGGDAAATQSGTDK